MAAEEAAAGEDAAVAIVDLQCMNTLSSSGIESCSFLVSEDKSIKKMTLPAEGTLQPLPAILASCCKGMLKRAQGRLATSSGLHLFSKTGKP